MQGMLSWKLMSGFKGGYENCTSNIKFIGRLYYLKSCIIQVIFPVLVCMFLLERMCHTQTCFCVLFWFFFLLIIHLCFWDILFSYFVVCPLITLVVLIPFIYYFIHFHASLDLLLF